MCLLDVRNLLHNFRSLKMVFAIEKDGTQFVRTTLARSWLSLLLQKRHDLKLIGKLEQVSTCVSWQIPLYQVK